MDPELIAYFDQHFSSLNQRFDRVDQRLDGVDQRFDGVDQRLDGMAQRLDRVETEVRHAHVLIEDLKDKVQIVAEAVGGIREQLKAHEVEVSTRFDKVEKRLTTIEAYAHTSYDDLNSRLPKRKRQASDRTGL